MDSNLGKYGVPPTLQRLINLQNDLGDTRDFFRGLDFHLSLENLRYFNTPSDVIIFGNIGQDGIHYGFLTDYGSVTELEVAPIVCVSPMDFDTPTRIVSRNLREFLRVNLTDGALFYNYFSSEGEYLETKGRWAAEEAYSPYQTTENEKRVRERVQKSLLEIFQLPHIDNPYRYVQDVGLVRQRNVSIQTMDGLGVIEPLLQHEKHSPFPIHKDTDPDLKLLQGYLYSAPLASRLALFRNLQFSYVLQDNHELHKIVIDTMNKMGLNDEANRLMR
ncbi:hypothetical protein ACQKGI_22040 [Peribacillus muralis]|uniref:hypothetical protein n=1 Tax=Peribacillus muralis TaxID=264697 RepID=UPI00382FD055